MPSVVSDAVDAYVIRRVNARLQFLLVQRRADAPLSGAWQALHAQVRLGETAMEAAERALSEAIAMEATIIYSTDYVNHVFDHARDAIVLVPVFAFEVDPGTELTLGAEFVAWDWCERDEAATRLLWAGQRWAVRHIDDVLGLGGTPAEFYRIR
jgi:8-oxo-dGTP pyrophosphatase MutT (NUDIX family)